MATQIIARVRSTFQTDIPLRAIFEHPTPETFALAIEQAAKHFSKRRLPAITPVQRRTRHP